MNYFVISVIIPHCRVISDYSSDKENGITYFCVPKNSIDKWKEAIQKFGSYTPAVALIIMDNSRRLGSLAGEKGNGRSSLKSGSTRVL